MRCLSRKFICRSVLLLSTVSASLTAPAIALAESILQVLPTRVVLEGPKRSMTVTLINRGDQDGNYRMFFRNIRANDNGEFSEVKEAIEGELFADNMVRFSPRRITVPARSKQSIRVLLRKPPGLDTGEYRSHLMTLSTMPKHRDAIASSTATIYPLLQKARSHLTSRPRPELKYTNSASKHVGILISLHKPQKAAAFIP